MRTYAIVVAVLLALSFSAALAAQDFPPPGLEFAKPRTLAGPEVTSLTGAISSSLLFLLGPSGGTGGFNRSDLGTLFTKPNSVRLSQVLLRCGARVDAVQGVLSDGTPLVRHGGTGGSLTICNVPSGVIINRVTGRYGSRVDRINLHLSNGVVCGCGGSGGSVNFEYRLPAGEVLGFFSRSGSATDAIGLIVYTR